MAHQITGDKDFISYQRPAWHNLGTIFDRPLTVADALNEAGLSFEVGKLPNVHRIPGQTEVISEDSFFTYRMDNNQILGDRLGSDYTVYQNKEALDIVDALLETGKLYLQTAGSINEGRKVFMCMKHENKIIVDGKDEIEQYVLLATSHDGSISITAMNTNIRVVCNNTLSAALGGSKADHKIRHTTNAKDRVKEAFTIMGLLESSRKTNEAVYNAMKCNKISKAEFFDYVGNVLMTTDEIKSLQGGKRTDEVLSTRKKNIISSVLEFAETGIGQREALDGGNLNMWYAYNAVTGYNTGKKYKNADDRFNSLVFGASALQIKNAGLLALHPDRIQQCRQKIDFTKGMGLN